MKNENNNAIIIGTVCSPFIYNHQVQDEQFYIVYVSTARLSHTEDILPVMVSEKLVDININMEGTKVEVEGSYRSWSNRTCEEKHELSLYVFAENIRLTEKEDTNSICLSGFLCRPPRYRETPLGRSIADLMLAVNRRYQKSDYIPVITWSRNAKYISDTMTTGDKLTLTGRIQSRPYQKRTGDICEERVAYEVSAHWINTEEMR